MNLNKKLYNGIVLYKIPVPMDTLHADLVKPRDLQWFKDRHEGIVDFRMKTNDYIYWVRWVGEWDIEAKRNLKKLMLRWHYDRVGRLETKDWMKLPFTYQYHQPIHVDQVA